MDARLLGRSRDSGSWLLRDLYIDLTESVDQKRKPIAPILRSLKGVGAKPLEVHTSEGL